MDSSEREVRGVGSRRDAGGRGALSPLQAFVVVAVLLAISAAAFLALRPEATAPQPAPAPVEPDLSLTESEAIARFKELRTNLNEAVRQRDRSLLSLTFVPGAEIRESTEEEIQQLIRDGVSEHSRIRIVEIEVVVINAEEVTLMETARLRPCFVNRSGRDITKGPVVLEQVGTWTLRVSNREWLIASGKLESDRVVRSRGDHCP